MSVPLSLQIFYDGSCSICVKEMTRYRRYNSDNCFTFIDISADDFDPAVYGKSREEFMEQLHVLSDEGAFVTGFDAVMAIWQHLPARSGRRLVAAIVGLPGLQRLGRRAYRLVARNRQRLPQRGRKCEAHSCFADARQADKKRRD